jgi:hypothetical protein
MHPDCPARCRWLEDSGRRQYFCSRSCRERYQRERQRLLDEIDVLRSMAPAMTTQRESKLLESHLARRRWLLSRYGSIIGEK